MEEEENEREVERRDSLKLRVRLVRALEGKVRSELQLVKLKSKSELWSMKWSMVGLKSG